MAVKTEQYPSRVSQGDLVLTRLALTGWGAIGALDAWTKDRRVFGRITTGNLLELWRTPTFAVSTDRLAVSGAITGAGSVSFAADNASGISGTCNVDYTLGEEQLFDAIVSYADEKDIGRKYSGLDNELDDDDKYEGEGVRFESLMNEAKKYVHRKIVDRYAASLEYDDLGRPILAAIADPTELADAHALCCRWLLYVRRLSTEPELRNAVNDALRDWQDELAQVPIAFDADDDGVIDEPKDEDVTGYCDRG